MSGSFREEAITMSCAIDLVEAEVRYSLWLPHRETDHIQKQITANRRPYEIGMLEDMKKRLSRRDHVLDIGANVGNHTLYLAAVVGCRVTAFEPNTELTAALRKSIELNSLEEKVRIVESGVGAAPGLARFVASIPENLGAQSLSLADTSNGAVQIIALDEMDDLDNVRMIKILFSS